ncbi:TetR/AcrR family transcriptional regulator [Pikeienuella piscinae]|uniref:TetR/AcrR family transcriptional regulator n=1 Tax=Pikeienuella piscinae TaxID=2748098 RepID=A0A7L5BU99_9RHOB|nr:TetR/AcrR family transcriptional regulator [Pikeienuella piscinae]QIE55162.1 TetR/AcrR family transcriptional regulator [Pikeienuella piscinae]
MIEQAKTAVASSDRTGAPSPGEAKRAQVLSGAREVFMARGFAAASMGEIARAAGVSKGTLYVYFDGKTALFQALISEQKRNTAERLATFDPADHDVEAVLRDFARRLIAALTAPEHVALIRMVIGAAEAFPDISRSFFVNGAAYGARRLAAYLAAQAEEGVLALDDPEDAAWRFLGMCNMPALTAVVLGGERPDEAEISRRADGAVKTFMAASRSA